MPLTQCRVATSLASGLSDETRTRAAHMSAHDRASSQTPTTKDRRARVSNGSGVPQCSWASGGRGLGSVKGAVADLSGAFARPSLYRQRRR